MSFGAALSGFADGFRSGKDIQAEKKRNETLDKVLSRTGEQAPRPAYYDPAAPVPMDGGTGAASSNVQPAPAWDGPVPVDFNQYEAQYELPSGYLQRTAQLESSMGRNMKNPNSSATGPFQFIKSTAQEYGLTDPMDWAQSTDAASRLARDNAGVLRRSLGRAPTAAELYLAHQQGSGGAAQLLSRPDAPAVSIVGSEAVRLNGGREDMTAREFANLWINKFGDPTPTTQRAAPAPQATPQQRPPLAESSGTALRFPSLSQAATGATAKTDDPLLAAIFNRTKGAA